jgi:hypothetical protein
MLLYIMPKMVSECLEYASVQKRIIFIWNKFRLINRKCACDHSDDRLLIFVRLPITTDSWKIACATQNKQTRTVCFLSPRQDSGIENPQLIGWKSYCITNYGRSYINMSKNSKDSMGTVYRHGWKCSKDSLGYLI